ncbi:hypothetical protein LGR54_17690 [Ancylobacter sp. Lp-2]|uniref:hypothetical protein n=1 Tax=Ancylobacter sp. Lp-2 TaxID=2881339 RepID=UPI001E609F2B|nr:hypothetical protein [Ancylobacter sp. Lp-2]MCB4770444.1 hypothetical protein [Ancylobacter sp. Lp-2]
MSEPFDLAAASLAVRASALDDAGAAIVLAGHYAANDLARHLGAPTARYAVSTDGVRVIGGWSQAERILIVPIRTEGSEARLILLDRHDPDLHLTRAEPGFGLSGAEEGLLPANVPLPDGDSLTVPAAVLESALARHRLIAASLHLAVVQGTLDGFLDRAVGFLKARSTPWYGAGLAHATDDPHALRTLGLLFARRNALDALAAEALAAVGATLDQDHPSDAVSRLDIARHYAKLLARTLVNEGIGLLGASSASGKHGFDRFWRDIATHELHYPPHRDAEALGRDFITETRAAP